MTFYYFILPRNHHPNPDIEPPGTPEAPLFLPRVPLPSYLLVTYDCITKDHKLSSLKQHPFPISQFPGVRSLGLTGSLLRVPHVCAASLCVPSWSPGLSPKISRLPAEVGPLRCRTWVPVLCWPSAEGCFCRVALSRAARAAEASLFLRLARGGDVQPTPLDELKIELH